MAPRRSRRTCASVLAFKETDAIKDWRVKQMVETCHSYYTSVWSRGQVAAADALLDDEFVRRDLCSVAGQWGPIGGGDGAAGALVVGPRALKALVEEVRWQYPDFYVEVDEVAVSDSHRIYIHWTSHGTQLHAPHTPAPPPAAHRSAAPGTAPLAAGAPAASAAASSPSHHNNQVRGVDVITFNHDRSRILEVNVYRQLAADERHALEERLCPGPLEIHLAPLHTEPLA